MVDLRRAVSSVEESSRELLNVLEAEASAAQVAAARRLRRGTDQTIVRSKLSGQAIGAQGYPPPCLLPSPESVLFNGLEKILHQLLGRLLRGQESLLAALLSPAVFTAGSDVEG